MFENQVKKVFLGVGSNLGNRQKNIELSKIALTNSGIKILKSSSFYESLSWPDPKKPKFLNIVLEIETTIYPVSLLKICKKIEKFLGRKKSKKNSPSFGRSLKFLAPLRDPSKIFRPPSRAVRFCTPFRYLPHHPINNEAFPIDLRVG